jgi:ketosteroid isomerase-like protein
MRSFRRWPLGLIALAILAFSSVPAFAADAARTPDAVFKHHIQSWNDRNLDAIVEDYADDAVVIVQGKVHRSKAAVAPLFRWLFQVFEGTTLVFDPTVIEGNIVYITWRATKAGVEHSGTDTFVIENGRIRYQTVAAISLF